MSSSSTLSFSLCSPQQHLPVQSETLSGVDKRRPHCKCGVLVFKINHNPITRDALLSSFVYLDRFTSISLDPLRGRQPNRFRVECGHVCVCILDPILSNHLVLLESSYKRLDQLLQSLFNGELCKDQRYKWSNENQYKPNHTRTVKGYQFYAAYRFINGRVICHC